MEPSNQHQCRICRGAGPFSPSRVAHHNWICTPCNNRQANSDPARYMARKLSISLKRRGEEPTPELGTEFVRQVMAKCEGQSVLSGEANLKRLCVARINDQQPWHVDNAVLVTSGESYALSQTRDAEQRMQLLRIE